MKADIAVQWANALNSGKFAQGKYMLCEGGRHCCLGVLCELAIEAGVTVSKTKDERDRVRYDDDVSGLPKSVMEWSGIRSVFGNYSFEHSLSCDNDNEVPFKKIATTILKKTQSL